MYARVIIDIAHANVDRLFTYEIPEGIAVQPGHRVLVPFGAGNRKTEGFVLAISPETDVDRLALKPILRTMEPYPALTEEQIALSYWIAEAYHCLLVDALRLLIPAQMRGGRVKEKTVRTVRLRPGVDLAAAKAALLTKTGVSRAPKQTEVLELVAQAGPYMTTATQRSRLAQKEKYTAAGIKDTIWSMIIRKNILSDARQLRMIRGQNP